MTDKFKVVRLTPGEETEVAWSMTKDQAEAEKHELNETSDSYCTFIVRPDEVQD